MHLKAMTVRTKLILVFATLTLMTTLVSGLALQSLQEANAQFSNYVQGVNARLLQSYEVRTAVYRRAIEARDFVYATNEQDQEVFKAKVVATHQQVQERVTKLTEMAAEPGVSDEVRGLIGKIAQAEAAYKPVIESVMDLDTQGKHHEAEAMLRAECLPRLNALSEAAHRYRDFTFEHAATLVRQANDDLAQRRNLLLIACLAAFAAAVGGGGYHAQPHALPGGGTRLAG
jgi:methyl-accepting chemotaxis protein-1 (serine sensor receptor)